MRFTRLTYGKINGHFSSLRIGEWIAGAARIEAGEPLKVHPPEIWR
jgi:hypothetical protein